MSHVLTQEEIDAKFSTPEQRADALRLLIELKYLVRQVYGFYPVALNRSVYKGALDFAHGYTINNDDQLQEGYDD